MTRKTFVLCLAAVLAIVLTAAPVEAKPNFSGTWKLLADKSDFGPMPPPDKYEQKVEHSDPDMKVTTTQVGQQGEFTSDVSYNTEGKETTNQLRGNAMKSVARWDGDTLVVDSKLDFQGNEITISDKWSLAEEGKSIIIQRKLNTPQGELEMKVVLAKQ
ncbi:MAG: hypothetical protein HY235_16860 [Acidobacteria bacterium]|nr:hypothetical protein [Acidobacteriota bacterium]